MRGIILALLLTLAGSQKFPQRGQRPQTKGQIPDTEGQSQINGGGSPEIRLDFINGKLYHYKYEGIIRNTAQGDGLGQSAVKLTSDISIHGGERENTLMFLSPQMEEFVGFPREPEDQFAEPKDQFTKPPKKPGRLDSCTLFTYHFEYNNGRIENIRVSTQVPLFCLNMVRGILNMLIATPRNQKEYELQEDGIDGECQTKYVIIDDRRSNGAIISRTKDLNNCKNKVKRTIGMSYVHLNPRCLLRNTMVQGTLAFIMKVRYEGSVSEIIQVESDEEYQVSPFSEADGSGVMTAWQKLTLIDVKPEHASKQQQRQQSVAEEKTVDIHYEFPENLPEMVLIEDAKRQIVEILEEVDRLSGIPLDVVPKYIELSQLFRRLTVEEMNTIYNDFGSRPRARQFLLIGVAYAGTLNSMKFIKDKLVKGELHNMEPYWVVPITLHFANPAIAKMEDTARVAAEILNKVSSSGSFWLQKLAFLGHGSLVYKQCSQSRACSNKLLEPLNNLLTEALSHHDENRMILALKSLGNAAQLASLKIVRPLAENNKYTKFIQAVAIQTLKQMGKQDPAKIQGILIQIYMNTSNSVQVRIMSSMAIFETYPTLPMITAIANVAFREKNPILYSFVYSQLKAWTKNRIPVYYDLSSACNVALKLLNPRLVQLNENYSNVVHLNFFNTIHRFGAIAKLFVIENPRGTFPSNVIFNTELIFSGTIVKPFEVTLQVEGLREWLRKLNVPFDQYSGQQKMKDVERNLPGFKDIPLERPLLAANLKILNQEVMFFTPEETMNLKKLGEGRLLGPEALGMIYQIIKNVNQQITQALILEVRHIVPTSLGLPFEVSASGIAMVHSSLKAVENYEQQQTVHKGQQQTVHRELQLESNVVLQGYGKLIWGINTAFCQHIVEITSQFRIQNSLKMNATWDVRARNLKFEIDPIHEEYELAVARHEAHVVGRYLNSEKKSPVLPERPEEDILSEEFKPRKDGVKQSTSSYKSNPRDVCYTFPIYPVKVCLETMKKTNDVMPLRNTWMHFLCETHEMRVLMTPVVAMEKIKGEIQPLLELPRLKRETKHHGGMDECRNYRIPSKGQAVPCTLENAPVCGSDGVTYPNKCNFCNAKWESGNKITIEHEGECEQEQDECHDYPAPPKGRDIPCTREFDPVCGSDHKTYSNRCVFCNAKRKSGNEITIEHEGECDQEGGRKSQKKTSGQSKKQDPDYYPNPDSSSSSSGSPNSPPSSSSSIEPPSSSSYEPSTKKRQGRRKEDSSDSSDTRSNDDSSDTRSNSDTRSSSDSSDSSESRRNKRLYQQKTKDSSSSSSDTWSRSDSSSESDESFEKKERRREIYQYTFRPVKQQETKRPGQSNSRAPLPHSGSSSEETVDYSAKKWVKVLIAHLRIIRRDKKPHGVDALVFKTPTRFRMIVSNLTRPGRPIVCFESGMLSPYKAMSSLKTGWDCKEYEVTTEVETGWLSVHPAIRWKVNYPRVPEVLVTLLEPIYSRIPGVAYMLGLSHKIQRNPSRETSLVLALTAPRSYAMVLRMPEYTVYGEDLMLPFAVPLTPSIQTSKLIDVPLRILASVNGVCKVKDQTITTFNERTLSKGLVSDCFLDLLQDCTCHKKIMVLMKYESDNNNYILVNVTVANTEIVFKSREKKLIATINGTVISSNEDLLSRLRDTEQIVIMVKEDKLILRVQNVGLEELHYDGQNVMVTVTPEIGLTCGLCGLYGGDLGKLRTPSGYLAKDLVSFAQSWVVPDESGETCKLQHSTVRHENPTLIAEENLQCVSNHPVLQCQEGCSPTQTTEISAGFHCVSAGTTLPTELTKLAEKSEDFVDTVQSHVACSCAQ